MLLREASDFALARDLRDGRLQLGEAFAFLSGLYFRGKLAYAEAFRSGPGSVFVITPTRGLQPPHQIVTADVLREFASIDVHEDDPRYRTALERDALAVATRLSGDARVVLLGSVATGKYVDVLQPLFGDRFVYPADFVGRGDMSRGGLLLRSARSGTELRYLAITSGVRPRGPRPARLPSLHPPSPVRMLRLRGARSGSGLK